MKDKKIIGVVVCGGNSERMGEEKYLIDYHGKPQWQHISELLEEFCARVVCSCSARQKNHLGDIGFVDEPKFSGHGPMVSLLTIWHHFPQHDLLVVACDYPYFCQEDLELLCAQQTLSAFYQSKENIFEPWLGFYPNDVKPFVEKAFEQKEFSIQPLLRQLKCQALLPKSSLSITSVDTPERRDEAKHYFQTKGKY